MAAPARIDELRHRYAAQPRRYLAPLANALREAGALEEAVTMLRAQLAEYPDHLTGHVVLGHTLFDTGALADAQTAFETARALDPGNRVVLRQLGEIASLAGDRDTARLWFERLRAAEPYADDVAAQLGGGVIEPPDLDEDLGRAAAITPAQEVSPAAPADAFAPDAFVSDAFVPEPIATDGFQPMEFDAAPLDPVVGLDVASGAPPAELQGSLPDAAVPLLAPAGNELDDMPPDDATAALDQITAGPFATETMAGLLAAQGHTEQAIALYERLTAERPADGVLRARLDALRGESEPVAAVAMEANADSALDPMPEGGAVTDERAIDRARAALFEAAFADLVRRPVRAATTEVVPSDDTDPFADVSFDRFFAEPIKTSGDAVDALAASAGAAPGDDADLARFDAWLRDASR